ncbi:hypothetical protein GCM10007424_24800 [Flavobacterium suaedae]|uniref:Lipoprotein n=1 Tax=Flavobacterium suaedae TaxID=1767027 RepID=A0ABQ1K4G1_9FLAO|nr:hypothetical protein [Flavobacterium suaedae]GGB83821.1 hypothetical protein GCM10007424_24800 [Flavobacterium suaedae]
MKVKQKAYLYIFSLAIIILLSGCHKKDKVSMEAYYEETEFDYIIRIVDHDEIKYFSIESNQKDISVLKYDNHTSGDKSNLKLSPNEIDNFIKAFKKQMNFDNAYSTQYTEDNKSSIAFYLYYGADMLEITYKGMKTEDLPIEIKNSILKFKE